MNTPNKPLNWKVAAAVGTLAGITVGGFVLAAPDRGSINPDSVVLNQDASVPRLSAPIVLPTTTTSLASAATIGQASAPSPQRPTTTTAQPPARQSHASADSPASAASPASPASPDSPASPASPAM